MGYLDNAGLQYLWGKLKEKFAPKSHSHDDRYYTEAEVNGKLNSKVDNNEAGSNGLLSKLTTSWTAIPTDNTYFIRQDTGGGNEFGRVKFSTIWSYIKGKADGVYQPKGSYAASGHTHDDRYYTESEMNTKLAGKSNIDHTHNTSSIGVGNVNYAGYAGPIESAHIDVLRANRLAFLPASGVKVEYSVDNGATWIDYGATDAQKASLFAMRMGSATPFYTGKHTKKEECITKDQLRITVTPVDRYASVNMLYLWVSVAGTSATVNISRSTIGAKETFTDVRTDVPISGWSGPNEIRFSGGTFGGYEGQNYNAYSYRFTFKNKEDGKGSVSVTDIRMYGPSAWTVPNSMMEKDHIYNWDANQNVQFPAQVTATKFNGSSTGVVDYGNAAGATIKVGFNGAGLTKDNLTHIAGYAKDGNQTVIKDVSKGVLQSWLDLGASAYKKVQSLSVVGHSDWQNQSTDDGYVPTMAFMAFWNGAFSGSGSSNLQYCDRGRFGTIVTKNSGDYAAAGHTHSFASITGKPSTYTPSAHTHDDRYYTETEINAKLDGKSNTGHTHDDRYYTESEINSKLSGKANSNHSHYSITTVADNRNTNTTPNDYRNTLIFQGLKDNSKINSPSSDTYSYLLGLRGWSDSSGGNSHELAFNNTGVYWRNGSSEWGGWNRLYTENYHPNADHASSADYATNATNATTATKLSSNAGSNTHPVYFSGGKPVVIGYTIAKSVPADAKFTDTTYGVASSTTNGLMSSTDKTKLDDFSRVISIQKQIKLTTDWQDTGIAGTSLDTGTYVVQVSGFNSSYTSLYNEVYSGIMTWYANETNSDNSSEIFLHNAGHADNSNAIYLRTSRRAYGNGGLHLQIACKVAATGTDTLTFKFRRLI